MSEKLSAARKLALVRQRQAELLEQAKAAVARAEAELARAKDHLAKIELETPCLLRLAELRVEAAAVKRQLRQLRGEAGPKDGNTNEGAPEAAGTVTAEGGEVRGLSAEAAELIKKAVGRKRRHRFEPLSGAEARALLMAIDGDARPPAAPPSVGDRFVVRLKGWKGALLFLVEDEGLLVVRAR